MWRKQVGGAALVVLGLICATGPAFGQYGYPAPPPPGPPPNFIGPNPEGFPFEWNTDRPGEDYTNFNMDPSQPPLLCEHACRKDRHCRAFSFIKPGVQGPYARCLLKHVAPPPVPNQCCITGVVR